MPTSGPSDGIPASPSPHTLYTLSPVVVTSRATAAASTGERTMVREGGEGRTKNVVIFFNASLCEQKGGPPSPQLPLPPITEVCAKS